MHGLNPGGGTKIPHATWCGQKKSVQFWGIKVDAIIPLLILLLLKLEYFITYIYVPCTSYILHYLPQFQVNQEHKSKEHY